MTGKSQDGQRHCHKYQGGLSYKENPAPVKRICNRPAQERKYDNWQDACQPDSAQSQGLWFAGQDADMPKEGGNLHLRASNGNKQSQPEVEETFVTECCRDGNLQGLSSKEKGLRLNLTPNLYGWSAT